MDSEEQALLTDRAASMDYETLQWLASTLRGINPEAADLFDARARVMRDETWREVDEAAGQVVTDAAHGGLVEVKNAVRVGVKGWDGASPSTEHGRWSASIMVMWIEVDGKRLPIDVAEVDLLPLRADFHMARVLFPVSKFELVDANSDPA